jgi:hypothetical protein
MDMPLTMASISPMANWRTGSAAYESMHLAQAGDKQQLFHVLCKYYFCSKILNE